MNSILPLLQRVIPTTEALDGFVVELRVASERAVAERAQAQAARAPMFMEPAIARDFESMENSVPCLLGEVQ